MNHFLNLKLDKDEDQLVIKYLLKILRSLGYDVYNNNIKMEFF